MNLPATVVLTVSDAATEGELRHLLRRIAYAVAKVPGILAVTVDADDALWKLERPPSRKEG